MNEDKTCATREAERAELASAAQILLDQLDALANRPAEANIQIGNNRNGQTITGRTRTNVDTAIRLFLASVLEHVRAEHAPGAAADALHDAARGIIEHMTGRRGEPPAIFQACVAFVEAENERRLSRGVVVFDDGGDGTTAALHASNDRLAADLERESETARGADPIDGRLLNGRLVAAREGDVFLPITFHSPLAKALARARDYEHGNVLRDDSLMPARRYPDGSILVLEP